jgi:hypothetical protein
LSARVGDAINDCILGPREVVRPDLPDADCGVDWRVLVIIGYFCEMLLGMLQTVIIIIVKLNHNTEK